MTDLNKLRSEFENLSEIAEILNEEKSHFNGDFYNLPFNSCAESFINGAWYAWQEKAKAEALQQSFEIGRLQDRITELLDERQDLYAQINNEHTVPEGCALVSKDKLHEWYCMANRSEELGCPECYEARGYAHNLACELNEASESGAEG